LAARINRVQRVDKAPSEFNFVVFGFIVKEERLSQGPQWGQAVLIAEAVVFVEYPVVRGLLVVVFAAYSQKYYFL